MLQNVVNSEGHQHKVTISRLKDRCHKICQMMICYGVSFPSELLTPSKAYSTQILYNFCSKAISTN
jgi:hypothetical protein